MRYWVFDPSFNEESPCSNDRLTAERAAEELGGHVIDKGLDPAEIAWLRLKVLVFYRPATRISRWLTRLLSGH